MIFSIELMIIVKTERQNRYWKRSRYIKKVSEKVFCFLFSALLTFLFYLIEFDRRPPEPLHSNKMPAFNHKLSNEWRCTYWKGRLETLGEGKLLDSFPRNTALTRKLNVGKTCRFPTMKTPNPNSRLKHTPHATILHLL